MSMSIIRSEYLDAYPCDRVAFVKNQTRKKTKRKREGDTEEGDDDDENSGYSV